MTIFDSEPIEINRSLKPELFSSVKLSPWYFDLPNSTNEYKFDEKLLRKVPSRKKVTFADEKGQELVDMIRIARVDSDSNLNSLLQLGNSKIVTKLDDPPVKIIQPHDWVTSFIQPASVYNRFKSQLLKQNIKLATAIIVKESLSDTSFEYKVSGMIKVINLCFEKRVFVRLSTDSKWSSSTDHDATYKGSTSEYVPNSNTTCSFDEFEFLINLPTSIEEIPTYLEFAVGMETPNGNYWDSNCDKNYRVDYCQVVSDKLLPLGLSKPSTNGYMSSGPYTLDYKPNFDPFRNEYTQYRAWSHFSDEMSFY